MQEEDLAVLADFETVWLRVLREKERDADPFAPWAALLQGMYEQWRWLKDMARCTCGEPKRVLECLCTEAEQCFRELQTACFLDTGDVFVTRETCSFASCTPYNLRKLYQNAAKLAQLLQNASLQEKDLLLSAASAMERQAVCLRRLVCRALQ